MSFGEEQPMDIDLDEQELQRHRKEGKKNLSSITPKMMQALFFEDASIQLKAIQKIRKRLMKTSNLPLAIEQVIKSGAVSRFVHFLEDFRYPEQQYASAWVLTIIAGGNSAQTQAVIDCGAVPVLIRLLTTSSNRNVLERSIWALGNIAYDSTECRDLVLNSNMLPPLLGLFNNGHLSTSMMGSEVAWALSGLCRGNPPPNFAQVSPCLPLLTRLMVHEDATVLTDACKALSSLCYGPNEQIQVVIESDVCPLAVQLLSHTSNEIVSGALILVCNLTSGTEAQVQVLINAKALPALGRLLFSEKESIVANACRTLANITSVNEQQIQAVIEANIVPSLIMLLHNRNVKIGKDAAWAIANATSKGSVEKIVYIVEAGAIAPLCKLLSETDSGLIENALSGLSNILRTGETFARFIGNPFATLICNSPSMKLALYSVNAAIQLDATKRFRKLLGTSEGFNLLIDEVIKHGAVPRFIHFLEDFQYPKLQFESASVLTNIARGNSAHTQVVIESGAVPILIRLLTASSNHSVIGNSVWALGNLARNSTESRDLVLKILPPLLGYIPFEVLINVSPFSCRRFNDNASWALMRIATWSLRNLCRHASPPVNFEQLSQCLPVLSRLIRSQDAEVLAFACWALKYLAEGPEEQIQVVIDSGVCPRAIQLLSHSSLNVVKPALRLVGNIAAGNDSQTQVLINANALPALGNLLAHEKESIVKDTCCTLANITAGNKEQIQAVIDAHLFPTLIELLHDEATSVRKQAARAIANATFTSCAQQMMVMVEAGALPPLCALLTETDPALARFAFRGLENILRTGESFTRATGSTVNPFAVLICKSPEMNMVLFFENTAFHLHATERFRKLLSNFARSPSAQTQGLTPNSIRALSSFSIDEVVGQLVQALGNAVYNSTESRHLMSRGTVLPPLLGLLNGSHNLNTLVMRIATWTLSCLCFGNCRANVAQVPQALPLLTRLMFKQNAKVLASTCLTLAYFGEDSDEKLQAIINSGVCLRAIQLLSHSSTNVVLAALRLVLIIITGDDSQIHVLINANALPVLGRLLLHEKECIVMEACLILASITAGSEKQIQALIDVNLIHLLIELLHYGTFRIRQSVAWALANATANGSEQQIVYIVEAGAILPLCNLLYGTDFDLMEEGLICLANILRIGKGMANAAGSTENPFANLIKRWAGFDKIAFLSFQNDQRIKESALTIFKMLFGSKLKYNSD